MNTFHLGRHDALVVVDMQNDFLPGGSLGVPHGDEVIGPINRLLALYGERGLPIFASRDWHPENHCSFAAQGGPWPSHCVAGTRGAEFSGALAFPERTVVISKATSAGEDAYSAFNGTDLAEQLKERGVRRVAVCGLATDYCVLNTALDAIKAGFETLIVPEAMRAVDVRPGDGPAAIEQMIDEGAHPVELSTLG
jgi:nicotinamidase/pyrazinamidase